MCFADYDKGAYATVGHRGVALTLFFVLPCACALPKALLSVAPQLDSSKAKYEIRSRRAWKKKAPTECSDKNVNTQAHAKGVSYGKRILPRRASADSTSAAAAATGEATREPTHGGALNSTICNAVIYLSWYYYYHYFFYRSTPLFD